MGDWVDFKAVKEQVTMHMLLERYTMKLRRSGRELRGKCPIHHGEGSDAFHVSTEKNVFQCFSCGAKGNVLDLVAALEDCSVRDAAVKLQEWFGIRSATERRTTPRAAEDSLLATKRRGESPEPEAGAINPPLAFQLRVDCGHPYGQSRGLSRETVEYFAAGFCLSKGTFAGRFVIPLHDEQARLVGYAGRAIDDREPKYLFPSAEKGFYKRYLLFNLHRVLANPPADGTAVIVEGFFDAMKVHEAGYTCVGLLGSSLSLEQEELLARHFQRVVLLLDGDDAGKKATEACLLRLGRRMFVKAVLLPEGKQPDMLSVEELDGLLKR